MLTIVFAATLTTSLLGSDPFALPDLRLDLTAPAFALTAQAQKPPAPQPPPAEKPPQDPMAFSGLSRAGRLSLRAGMGFTANPGTFLMALEADYFLSENLSVGPLFQAGFSDDPVIIAPSVNFQWMFDLPPGAERIKPFVQGGLGFAYVHKERNHHDDDDVGFLMNFGPGVEVDINDHMAIGSNMLFNFLPVEVLDEHFFFSWQVATFTYRF